MIKTSPLLRSAALCFVLFFASLIPTARSLASATTAAPASACAAADDHQLDSGSAIGTRADVSAPTKSSLAIKWIVFSMAASCARITTAQTAEQAKASASTTPLEKPGIKAG